MEYVVVDARLRLFDLLCGLEPTTSADEKRNRERPAADLEYQNQRLILIMHATALSR